ncbi:MAG: ribonuclease H-like domain-containing protein [Chloroflexi bacterium]|nr:ribonuclease H-like domain-containing protein [Chloroflexota bacterium]
MSGDLRRRLERLERGRPRPRARTRRRAGAQDLPPGEEVETAEGLAYRIDTRYSADYRHGRSSLQDVLSYAPGLAAEVANDAGLERSKIQRWGFVDIETTGLSGGAGTLGFLIGLGSFQKGGFTLRQYFLRDPEEEAAALQLLRADLEGVEGIVTFNGRTFDLPILESRYTIALRDRWKLSARPHLDLLYPSRRLWSKTLVNCRLSTLERHVLQVERTEEDVPGELIPGMYLDYLRTGDASDMARVIYHNAIDILSLVGLSSVVLNRHRLPDPTGLSEGEALAVARWHEAAGRIPESEAAYRAAVSGAPNGALHAEALKHLTALLKRQNRRPEALPAWAEWHRTAPDDPFPCIELAMYYEWEARSLAEALKWAEVALNVVEAWPKGWRREQRIAEIEHRIHRLQRKLAS